MASRKVINSRYELEPLPLARGGMGEVWVGRDIRLEREVAVKFLRFPNGVVDNELVRRFVRESRITARLEHPGVPAVFDVGTYEDRPYLVMQRVRGVSVADLVAEHEPLPVPWAVAIAAQACAVLSVAHQASLVHRDLKPSNLMLCPDGTVKVLDFGLAVALDMADFSTITRTGQSLGTPSYMAPEQVLAGMSGPQTDLYALGCMLHEMLTGRRLFTGSTAYAVMNRQVDEEPRPVRRRRPDVPVELDRLITHLLQKKPEDRPGSADVVFERLLPFVTPVGPLPGVLHPPSTPDPVRMYVTAVGQVLGEWTDEAQALTSVATGEPGTSGAAGETIRSDASASTGESFSRGELARARAEGDSLMQQSRYSQAAEVLAAVAEPASRVLGAVDTDVLSLRQELADVLFEGGDFRQAAPAYHQLTADLAKRADPDVDRVFRCRLQEATCHALTGQTAQALEQLRSLLEDEHKVFGPDDDRPLELRRQIGLLELGAGQLDAAHGTLQALFDDLVRLHGVEHPTAVKIRELLGGIRRTGRR